MKLHDGETAIYGFQISMHTRYLRSTKMARSQVALVPEQPSGLGCLPDGSMLIVSMKDRKFLRLAGGVLG